eukprot:2598082-Pyramimonas_sp.AAC.1
MQLRSEESEKYNQSASEPSTSTSTTETASAKPLIFKTEVVAKTKKRAKPTLVLPDECSGDCGADFTPLLMKDKHGGFSQEWHAERIAAVANFTV